MIKIAWGITGCGDRIKESVEIMKEVAGENEISVDVFLSRAGEMVVKWYRLFDELKTSFPGMLIEKSSNVPFIIGDLQSGKYEFLLIMPSSSNTVAKIAVGISDTLLTNAVAQAMKAGVPIYIFPVDQAKGKIITELPNGRKLTLSIRDVDIEAVDKLRKMSGITVMARPDEIREIVKRHIEMEK